METVEFSKYVLFRAIWARHTLWDEVSAQDHHNDRPYFNPDSFFDYDVNHYYTMVNYYTTFLENILRIFSKFEKKTLADF